MALSRRARISLWTAAAVMAALAASVGILIARFQPVARDYVISSLKQRYKSDVELGNLQISLFPVVRATGENLVLRFSGRRDVPPMVTIRRFTIEARFIGFFRYPRRIRKLRLEGLQIHIPPKLEQSDSNQSSAPSVPFILEEVLADGTTLETLPADPKKNSLNFDIQQLTLHSVGLGRPMTFHAEVNNAKPPGLVHSDGQFGPWNQDVPGNTPISGKYTFRDADLSVFHGIKGTLASEGDYRGQLNHLDVRGTTDVPRFSITLGGHPMPLHTEFHATVDATNGNTDLHPVRALLGKSAFEVSGSIERAALETHKEIDLEAKAAGAGLDDFLRLAINSPQPPITGRIGFDTKVKIPPGKTPVIARMELNGTFTVNGVRFTSQTVQSKIASLSHHAQGEPKDTDTSDVTARFAGRFFLRNGVLGLPQLRFELPGAHVTLDGQYAVQSGKIDFAGTAKLDATVSQMTTGIKRVLLKPIDPLFKRDGAGTVLPIRISGTRGSPSFQLDVGRILKRKGED